MNIPHPKFKRSNFKKPTKSTNTISHVKLPIIEKLISNDEIELQNSNTINNTIKNTINNIYNVRIGKNKQIIKNTNKFHNILHFDFNNSNNNLSKKQLKHSYTVMNYEEHIC